MRSDQRPSCSVKGNLYADWSTGEHYDQIGFFAAVKGIPSREAIRELARIFRIVDDLPTRHPGMVNPAHKNDREEKARKRAKWPTFEVPTAQELSIIAELRGLSEEGVQLATKRGLVFCADSKEGRTWIVTDSSRVNAQARRMDGKPSDRFASKAWTLPGSEAARPIGLYEAASYPAIALVEGGPDLLAGFHLAWCSCVENSVAVVAILGAAHWIPDSSISNFVGKRVRVFADADAAGQAAGARWAGQLRAMGVKVDGYSFTGLKLCDGNPINDLNHFAHVHPDQWECEREVIEEAFDFANERPNGGSSSTENLERLRQIAPKGKQL